MAERIFFDRLLLAWIGLSVLVFLLLFFVSAPYGRHARSGWGPAIGNRAGWAIMESAAPIAFGLCFWLGEYKKSLAALVFLGLWEAHYIHRAFIYPFRLRSRDRSMPWVVILFGFGFNAINGYLNGRYLFTLSGGYSDDWLGDPRFWLGSGLFALGYLLNRQSDGVLLKLRDRSDSGYKIPQGYLFRWVSCPNYLGEIVLWIGWAIATWSWPGLAFALWTVANLAPRARDHHRWYRQHFPDYPPGRKALLPGLW